MERVGRTGEGGGAELLSKTSCILLHCTFCLLDNSISTGTCLRSVSLARAMSTLAALPPVLAGGIRQSDTRKRHTSTRVVRGAVASSSTGKRAREVFVHLEGVKNFRDLAGATRCVKPGRLFRTATPGDATPGDAVLFSKQLHVTSLIDLRSDDEFEPELGLVQSAFGMRSFTRDVTFDIKTANTRHHIPMLDYTRYYKAILSRMTLVEKFKAAVFNAQAVLFDPTNQRAQFVVKVNEGGLFLLNEIMVDTSGPEILAALDVISTTVTETTACAFYCKQGKDRTGLVALFVLHVCGASETEIVDDYHLSDAMRKTALGAVSNELKIDYTKFAGAPCEVVQYTLAYVKHTYGSLDEYLDQIGFDDTKRRALRKTLCE